MASALLPKGLTRQIAIVLILAAMAGIVGVSLAAWQAERAVLEDQVNKNLVMVANLKSERLHNWLAERQADARLLAVNQLNQEHFTELFDDSVDFQRKRELAAFLRDNLAGLQGSRKGYMEVSMTDRDGIVVIGTNFERVDKPALPADISTQMVPSIDGSFFYDIFLHPDTGNPVMAFGHDIRAIDLATHKQTDRSIGAVITIVEMADTVYSFLGPISELGDSAEALLVRPTEDGVIFLSRLRFLENAPLKLTAGLASPIAEAVRRAKLGEASAFHSTDYADQPVIAAYRQIEPAGWGLVVKQSEAEAFAPIYDLARRIALLTILVLLGAMVLAIFLARTLTRPIGALVKATQSIAEGNLGVSLHDTRTDELGALSLSFQKMVDALQERGRVTQHLTDMLQRHADELEAAYSDLRRSDQLKDAFIRNITHELRTPIAILSGFTELLMDDADEFTPEQQEMLEAIASQSQQVTQLVSDVVALHNIAANSNERRPLRMVDIVRAGMEAYRHRAKIRNAKGVYQLEFYCSDNEIEVFAHPSQMTRVFDSLLNNAFKFSPAGGIISVQLRHIEKIDGNGQPTDWQIVSVADEGIGIDEDDLPHIWERFFQADYGPTRRFGGTGLGLALVKEVVEAHGGQVWIDSLLGEGTTVSFSLPIYRILKPIALNIKALSSVQAYHD